MKDLLKKIENSDEVYKKWDDILSESFPTKKIKNILGNFEYTLSRNSLHLNSTIFEDEYSPKKPVLCILNGVKDKNFESYYSYKSISIKYFSKYFFRFSQSSDDHLDFKDQVVNLLQEILDKKNSISKIKNLKILLPIGHTIFFDSIKFLALKQLLYALSKELKLKTEFSIDVIHDDSVYVPIDYKNNVTRLTYYFMSSIFVSSSTVIVKQLPKYSLRNSCALIGQIFNCLYYESDINNYGNAFAGAFAFENAISTLCSNIWKCFTTNENKKNNHEVEETQKLFFVERLKSKKHKIIGLNDFIVPTEKIIKYQCSNSQNSIIELRNLCGKFYKKHINSKNFYYFGEREKINKKINELSQFFAIASVETNWEELDPTCLLNLKSKNLVIVSYKEMEKQFQNLIANYRQKYPSSSIFIFFESDLVVVKNKIEYKFPNVYLDFNLWSEILKVNL